MRNDEFIETPSPGGVIFVDPRCADHKLPLPCFMCRAERHECVLHGLAHPCFMCAAAGLPTFVQLGQPDSRREVYLFWHRRPNDKQAWPVVYESKDLAESCKFRIGPVVPVRMPALPPEGEAKQDQGVEAQAPQGHQGDNGQQQGKAAGGC